jgi:hypothetical protein
MEQLRMEVARLKHENAELKEVLRVWVFGSFLV